MWWEVLIIICDVIFLFKSFLLERYFRFCEEFVFLLNVN